MSQLPRSGATCGQNRRCFSPQTIRPRPTSLTKVDPSHSPSCPSCTGSCSCHSVNTVDILQVNTISLLMRCPVSTLPCFSSRSLEPTQQLLLSHPGCCCRWIKIAPCQCNPAHQPILGTQHIEGLSHCLKHLPQVFGLLPRSSDRRR